MDYITNWFSKYLSDPQVVFLTVLLTLIFTVIMSMSDMLAPVLASIVIAYLLEGLVKALQKTRLPRLLSVIFVFLTFMAFLLFIFLALIPFLYHQVEQLYQQSESMIIKGQQALMQLPERYPNYVTEEQIFVLIGKIRDQVNGMIQYVLNSSKTILLSSITILVYAILMPILVFFFLKDKETILKWVTSFFPKERHLANKVWHEVDLQIGNYVRGKFWEILVIWSVSFMTFAYMGLQYAMLLGVLVGLSVIIPYIGAVVVTFPVLIIAFFQWGTGNEFVYLTIAYFIIQGLDGNVLVPLLFSEVVNLHPIAIIVSILVFGGFWGIWGVFFAIPLATLVQAVITAIPKSQLQNST